MNRLNFIASYYKYSQIPKNFTLEQIAIFGRSNAGKSSLINSIFSQNIAKTSSKPGKTQSLNFFQLGQKFYIVDLPGFGYAKVSNRQHKSMMELIEVYLNSSKYLNKLFILCDSKRELPKEEISLIETCYNKNIIPILIRTKTDKLNQKQKALLKKQSNILQDNFKSLSIILTSIYSMMGIEELRDVFGISKKDKK